MPATLPIRLPLALLGAMLLQAATALWWAAQQGSAISWHETRLAAVEAHSATLDRQLLDRLARIEERVAAQAALLGDIKNDLRRHPHD